MFIIYGSRATHLKSVTSETAVCPHCGSTGRLAVGILARYAHIFWIPFFPMGRKTIMHCTACNKEIEDKNMLAGIKKVKTKLEEETKIPRWQFSGLILIGTLIFVGFFTFLKQQNDEKGYILNPKTEDEYSYHPTEGTYSKMKVVEVTTDSVYVVMDEYISTKGESSFAPEYAEQRYAMSKESIQKLYRQGDIYAVTRKK